jgi:hypothetical protein
MNEIPADILAEMRAVAESLSTGKPIDSALSKRIEERSKEARETLLKQFGVREIAADLIRETREE